MSWTNPNDGRPGCFGLPVLILVILGAACVAPLFAQPRVSATEPSWSGWIAEQLNAEAEAPIRDADGAGRVDVLTDTLAIEVEWAKASKGPESLNQAIRYALATERKPAVVFLVGRGNAVAEKAIAATVTQFGKKWGVLVVWFDVRDPDISRLRRVLGLP